MDTRKVGKEDFISKLPNDVVAHILSYLNTKEAVQTAVLSRRWRYLWTYIHSLNFNDFHIREMEGRNQVFMDFVDRVLGLRGSRNIQTFTLGFYDFRRQNDLLRVNAWINYALCCNVKELDLFLLLEYEERIPVRLPENFSSCESLVALKLRTDFVFTIPSTITCFPSLKVLRVDAKHPDCEFLSTLFCRCPVLEDLFIYVNDLGQDGDDQVEHTFTISIPTLKRLKIDICRRFENFSDQKFIIQTPNLVYLTIQDDSMAYFVIDEIPSLLEAKVSIGHSTFFYKDQVSQQEAHRLLMGILKGIRNAKFLNLSASTTAALSYAVDDDLPTFLFMLRLEMGIDHFFGWKSLPHFLRNSPILEFLVLERVTFDEAGGELDVEDNFGWIPPMPQPYCLLQHLKEIKMRYLWALEDEAEVVKYLLENGKVLEKMSFMFDEDSSEEELNADMIEEFPRGSEKCVIEFD
ncbi:F-box/LRR-repeat protein At4g14103-like [Durio zibethinus]|uniref:F-box/LRR-repeat protein At4g14103-like n=1 Tax=Durio zibethinus TaxID=66656 RepID=A0A6P5Y0Q0_DURZI|nr:F-box/LRR-repeat protein At4g14103-like [Durio zibethinus]